MSILLEDIWSANKWVTTQGLKCVLHIKEID
jgi:hypothetical protein